VVGWSGRGRGGIGVIGGGERERDWMMVGWSDRLGSVFCFVLGLQWLVSYRTENRFRKKRDCSG
jgi:hypothetical protein